QRLRILAEHKLGLNEIQEVIVDMGPMDGALEFVDWLRERFQVVILSDTFYEFAQPLMRQLRWPTLLCHKLEVADDGRITDYKLRHKDPKRQEELDIQALSYRNIHACDTYIVSTIHVQDAA